MSAIIRNLPAIARFVLLCATTVAVLASPGLAPAQIFVANHGPSGSGSIGEYNLDGTPINDALVSGLAGPATGIAVSEERIFVALYGSIGWIAQYTTSGTLVSNPVYQQLFNPTGVAVSGSNVFVAETGNFRIGEYAAAGATVNATLIYPLPGRTALRSMGKICLSQTRAIIRSGNTPRLARP